MPIPLENITPGMGLVILRGPHVREPIGAYGIETEFLEDRWLQGALLLVKAVSAPYVYCAVFWPHYAQPGAAPEPPKSEGSLGGMFTYDTKVEEAAIDTRRYELGAASRELVKAMLGAAKSKPGKKSNAASFWDIAMTDAGEK